MKFVFHLLLLVAFSALAGAAWVAHRPANLANIGGLDPQVKTPKGRDVLDELRQAAIKRSAILEISEAELNHHLAATLGSRMVSPVGQWAKFERVVVDLEPDIAHAILIWDIGQHRSTATVDLRIVRLEKSFHVEVVGGRYGHLEVPRGLLRPLAPVLESLSRALEEDIQALFQMNQVKLVKDKLVLDPRFL